MASTMASCDVRVEIQEGRITQVTGRTPSTAGLVPEAAATLEEIEGIGPARRRALLRHFGSVQEVRAATVHDLAGVPGFSHRLARTLHRRLRVRSSGPGSRENQGMAGQR
jgi:ERCC4-type nuclease